MKRLWLWPLAAAVAGAMAFGASRFAAGQPSTQLTPAATQALAADGMTPVGGRPAPDFHLIDQHGHPVSLSDFRHKVVILTFFDPVCWIDCPLQAHEMAEVDNLLGPKLAKRVALVAIAANPIYYSVADVQRFIHEQLLTGVPNLTFATSPSLAVLRQVWKKYYEQVNVPINGMIDHTVVFWLIGPNGGERYLTDPQANPEYVWGTSQLLATYVERLLHASPGFAADRPTPLPPTAQTDPIAQFGPVAVHFASPSTGWMVMDVPPYQVLYTTTDGGARWKNVGPPGVSKEAGLAWSWGNASTAWVLVRPFVWLRDTSVFLTTSAGRAWKTPALLPGSPAPQATVPLSGAGAERAGLLLGGRLWTTTDGGRTWKPAAGLPPQVKRPGLSWAPGATAWLGGRPPRAGAARLWRAQAGRAPWKPVDLPVPARFSGADITTLPPVWTSPRRGTAAVLAGPAGARWLWIASTSDAGGRWSTALPPLRVAGSTPGGGVQVSGDTVYALADGPGGVTVQVGDVTTGSWTRLGSPLSIAGAHALDFLSARDGWIVGGNAHTRTLWQTRDGGATWTPVHLPCKPSLNLVSPEGGCPSG